MSNSFKTFLKHTAKDFHNQSVNPPIVRASTIIFKSMQDIRKTQEKAKKNPTGGHFDYGRQGTSTTHILQQILSKLEESYFTFLTPTGFGSVFLAIFSVTRPGDEIIVADTVYSPTRLLTENFLKEFKIKTTFYNPHDLKTLEKAITKKTKLIMVSHMINITGQILPVKKICEMAHSYGIDVLVDGAHCVGHIDVNIKDLDCDYYGSSLHKWLSAPLGTGLLFIKKNKISKIQPLFAGHVHEIDSILRLNHIGTHPVHSDLAINDAIDYLESISLEKKENRLRYIQRYWSEKVRGKKNIIINTPSEVFRSCGIANVGVKNIKPADLADILFTKYGIFTVPIDYANVKGCRITPNIYTNEQELDYFVDSIFKIASN